MKEDIVFYPEAKYPLRPMDWCQSILDIQITIYDLSYQVIMLPALMWKRNIYVIIIIFH